MAHRYRWQWTAVLAAAALAAGPTARALESKMESRVPHYYERPHRREIRAAAADVCVYGGTACGVIAAQQLRKLGRSVVLIANGEALGGMSSGGLSDTDIGNKGAIGGLSREFYGRLGKRYGEPEEWRFEPHAAQEAFEEIVREEGIDVRRGEFLKSVVKKGARIVSLTTESGLTVHARCFVDATYEGDLMARAGVKFAVGREANSAYGETLNGVQMRDQHQFTVPVDPYVREGDSASGLLPGISPEALAPSGSGDRRVQAYNFRLCLTRDRQNQIPFVRPKGYRPEEYVLLARALAAGWTDIFRKFDPIQGGKVDKNNYGAISTDYIGASNAYPEASYAERERIFQAHRTYTQGWLWFLANDPSVPEPIRQKMGEGGLCRDEFTATGGWPHQLYVREARRMVSDYVMTEHNCRGERAIEDSVGLAAYTMDSHNCQRVVVDGKVRNEGDVQVGGAPPYPISYRSIVPREAECDNLLVPVCLSASHIAYGSIRMEPVFMILGQSAAFAADAAVAGNIAVQRISYPELAVRLAAAGQRLAWRPELH